MVTPLAARNLVSVGLFLVLVLAACAAPGSPNLVQATLTPTPSPTPTVTPIPMAVTVNGTGITVPEFEAGVTRYQQAQAALGITVSLETANKNVIDEFIAILLMEQAATAEGYKVDEASLQSRIDDLVSQLGSPEALTAWQTAHGYTEATFRSDLRRQMAAAFMRDQITASVPPTAEQVHVIQILLYDEAAAQQALGYLKAGRDFNELAAQYDPIAKGELGWFPRGYLSDLAGRVPVLMVGSLGVALVMLGYMTVAHRLPLLVGVQTIRGVAYASHMATAMTFAAELGDRRTRGSNSGLFNAASGSGQLLGLLMGGTLAQNWGFEAMFGACAVAALLSGACFWMLRHYNSDE